MIGLLLHCECHCCILPFSEIKLIISATNCFSFQLFPSGNWLFTVQIFLSPSNLPLLAVFLFHCQSHQRPPLLPSSPLDLLFLTSQDLKNPKSSIKTTLLLKTGMAPASMFCRLLLCYLVCILGIFLL